MKRMRMGLLLLCLTVLAVGCAKKETKIVIGKGGQPAASATGNAQQKNVRVYIYQGQVEDTDLLLFRRTVGDKNEIAYHYNNATNMYDRFMQPKTLEQLTPGEIYELTVDVNTQTITTMAQSNQVWTFSQLVNFHVDAKKEMLKVGNDVYRLRATVPVFDGDEQYTPEQIGEDDELTIIGKGKSIMSVIITTGHGGLAFLNIAGFEKGYFVLGNVAASRITKDQIMSVRAGKYLLEVAGSGNSGSEEVTINSGEVTTVDLKKFLAGPKKKCKLVLLAEQDGVKVTLNGRKIELGKSLSVPYGIYRLKATKDGYNEWSKILFVNSKTAKISIDLEDKSGSTNANANNTKPTSGTAGSIAGSKAGTVTGSGNETTGNNSASSGTTSSSSSSSSNQTGTTSSNSSVSGLVNEVMKILTDSGKSTESSNQSENQNESGQTNENE